MKILWNLLSVILVHNTRSRARAQRHLWRENLLQFEVLEPRWAPAVGGVGPTDANGTVQLNGTFTSVNFTATTVAGVSGDEIVLQIGVPLPGDYNLDGIVNAADYVMWRKNVGAPAGTLPNDIDGGTIGPAQYRTWRANFGEPNGAGAGAAGAFTQAAVPEPATLVLFVSAAASWRFRRVRAA